MDSKAILYNIIYFIVTVLVAWVVLSLVIMWFNPAFLNADGSVNWWTTLWVAALLIVFGWIFVGILYLLFSWIGTMGSCDDPCAPKCEDPCKKKVECEDPCKKKDPCEKKCDDPCAKKGW